MNISYATSKLEKILTNERLITKEYTAFHKKIKSRLSEIRAVNNLDEIPYTPPPRRHRLEGNYSNCWGIDISKNFRIVLKPTGIWNETDLSTITAVEIITIGDYH